MTDDCLSLTHYRRRVKSVRGWLPETIDAWNVSRPGRGRKAVNDQ